MVNVEEGNRLGMVVNSFFINISIVFLLMSLTFYLMRHVLPLQPASPLLIRISFGVASGVTAMLLTLNAFEVGDGRIDLRLIPLALAAVYAGPLGVVVALAVSLGGRMIMDGFGGPLLMMGIFFIFTLIISRSGLRRGHQFMTYMIVGSLLVLIRVTGAIDIATFVRVFIPYFVMSGLGGWLCYWGTKKLETHLWMFLVHTHRATVDELTGLANRYRTLEQLNEVEMAGRPWALFVIDVDHFKQLNDTYGHRAGDAALRHIGRILETICPKDGFVGRYGGEEFLLILERDTDVSELADAIVRTVHETEFRFDGTSIPMTVSVGVAVSQLESSMVVFERADQALYVAKRSGRNRASFTQNT